MICMLLDNRVWAFLFEYYDMYSRDMHKQKKQQCYTAVYLYLHIGIYRGCTDEKMDR